VRLSLSPRQREAVFGAQGCLATALDDDAEVVVRATGTCMQPEIMEGATLRLARRRLRPGDALAWAALGGERPTVHRLLGPVWWRGGWRLLTMGDRSRRPDAPIDPSWVLGSVVAVDGVPYRARLRHRLAASLRYLSWCARLAGRRVAAYLSGSA